MLKKLLNLYARWMSSGYRGTAIVRKRAPWQLSLAVDTKTLRRV